MALIALAGCLTDEPDPTTDPGQTPRDCSPTAFEDGNISVVDPSVDPIVDHREYQWMFNSTNIRTCSLAAIGHHELRDGNPHGYIGEIDMRGDLNLGVVAVLGAGAETPTAYLLDISNRSAPVVLSTIEMPGTYMVDVKIGDRGDYLFIASQTIPGPGETYGVLQGEPYGPTGFTVYDIKDRTAPSYVMNIPDTQIGCHMLNHEIVGTTHVVACVSQQVRLHAFEETAAGLVYITFVDYIPTGPNGLPLPSGIPAVGDPTGALSSGPHDMIIQRDEVTNDLVMIVSHWNHGVRVVDLNNAPAAVELGSWTGQGATHYAGNVHTAMMFYANGSRYIMASPEYTSGGNVASMWLLDATDYSDLKLVGEWYHPNEHDSQGLYVTTHQWQVAPTGIDVPLEDVRLYLTMNHAGIWVLGVEEILAKDLQGAIKGFHLSRTPLDEAKAVTPNAILSTWDVNIVDGYIYGSDRATGLWIFHYEEDPLGDPARTGFA